MDSFTVMSFFFGYCGLRMDNIQIMGEIGKSENLPTVREVNSCF